MTTKKIIPFSLTLLFVLVLQIPVFNTHAQSTYKYDVSKVTEGVYLLTPNMNRLRWVTANIVVVINESDVLVVDSGLLPAAATAAIEEIRKLTNKPVKYLVNTHWHGDHWQGNEVFMATYPGLEIIASAEGYNGIMRNGMVWVRQFYLKYLQMMADNYEKNATTKTYQDGKPIPEETVQKFREGVDLVKNDLEAIKKLKPTPPTLTFNEKMVMRKGPREIQFHYLGWGNTTGDCIVYLPNEKVLITGDLVVFPSPYESGAFSKEWAETSKKLKEFPFDYLIPGHGTVQKDTSYLDYLNALFAEVLKQINGAYTQGKTTEEEAKTVVTQASVVAELSKDPRFAEYLKKLDPNFVNAALSSAFQKAKEGKL